MSLWVKTLDPELPFTFLDHKIKVGNSLVGCWLDRVLDYPIRAWEREGGDGKDGPRTTRIDTMLKGEKANGRRSGDGIIKKEMRELIESHFTNQQPLFPGSKATAIEVATAARSIYELLHEISVIDPDQREKAYREKFQNSPPLRLLRRAMDEWCGVWFWPTDEQSMAHVPTPLSFHVPTPERQATIEKLRAEMRFFHWEIEFPDVFTPARTGFDATIGNPLWDVMKPNSHEFFSDFDPLYRTYDKQAALRRQRELFAAMPQVAGLWENYNARFKAMGNLAGNAAEPFDLSLSRGHEGTSLKSAWADHRKDQKGFADPQHPFRLQGSADLNLYKQFAEVFWNLLRADGRIGVILPTGIYSDLGTRDLREAMLSHGRIDLFYAFQNENRVFVAAHHAYKQAALIVTKGGHTVRFRARFRLGVGDSPYGHEIPNDILRGDSQAMVFTPEDIRRNSPKSLSLVELRTERDAEIFGKVYSRSIRIGDNAPGWEITYATEFHMTNDSKHFPPLGRWEAQGYKADVFGRRVGPEGDVALPLYEGRMIGQFDLSQKGWVSGRGRTAVWREMPCDNKRYEPQFLMSAKAYAELAERPDRPKIAFMDVTSATNTRTFVGTALSRLPGNHKVPMLSLASSNWPATLRLLSVCNSLCCDYMLRARFAGTSLGWFVLQELPIPGRLEPSAADSAATAIELGAARLCFLHRRFAPEWLCLEHLFTELGRRPWKSWWAVTESDRLRLRVEIDALCADLYGLDPDDFDWIVRDDPTDPKGFYRVDRQLPFRERLTGLAAAAFRALKDGKWSAESAAKLSNDEFFEMIGIPELTSAAAAKAMGLGEPLIHKRRGCHVWEPEKFAPTDPRYGWTWDDCWKDAIALLGSEAAVNAYIEQKPEDAAKPPEEPGGKSKSAKWKLRAEEQQGRLF